MEKLKQWSIATVRWFRSVNWSEQLSNIRNKLLTGIVVSVPLVVTLFVIQLVFNFVSGISSPLLAAVGVKEPAPGAPFFLTLLLFLAFGYMTANVLGARMFNMMERLVLRVPGISAVYSATKQVIESFKGLKSPATFQRVVYIDYPAPGCRLLGFVTGQYHESVSDRDVTTVFLPTSPNPLTGFILVVDSEKVHSANLTLDEATKLVVSAGLVIPRRPSETEEAPQVVPAEAGAAVHRG